MTSWCATCSEYAYYRYANFDPTVTTLVFTVTKQTGDPDLFVCGPSPQVRLNLCMGVIVFDSLNLYVC